MNLAQAVKTRNFQLQGGEVPPCLLERAIAVIQAAQRDRSGITPGPGARVEPVLLGQPKSAGAMVFKRGATMPDFTLVPVTVMDFYPRAA